MRKYLSDKETGARVDAFAWEWIADRVDPNNRKSDDIRATARSLEDGPLGNVWLGVSVESDAEHQRIWELLKTPAARRFISYEPALGPLDLHKWELVHDTWRRGVTIGTYLDLVIAGGESGRGARPSHPDWYRTVQRQCAETRTSFFFKQRGHWTWDKPAKPVKEWGTIREVWEVLTVNHFLEWAWWRYRRGCSVCGRQRKVR